jgi:hypothetical protein
MIIFRAVPASAFQRIRPEPSVSAESACVFRLCRPLERSLLIPWS